MYLCLWAVDGQLWWLDRGWGLRCLNDIPAGGFICIYAGQLLNDEGANEVSLLCQCSIEIYTGFN